MEPLPPAVEEFRSRWFQTLKLLYPNTALQIANGSVMVSPTLLSPHSVPVSRSVLRQAERVAQAFYRLRESQRYVDAICARGFYAADADPGNRGALMSFDFHLGGDDGLKLIEINTNASLGAMGAISYQAQGISNPFKVDFQDEIVATFQAEAEASRLARAPRTIAIVDRDPKRQRLYAEFLIYQELFEQRGIATVIGDTTQVSIDGGRARFDPEPGTGLRSLEVDLVYNRDVDFYFEADSSAGVKAAFTSGAACVSPNPFEYQALADKSRLIEIQEPGFLEIALPGEGQNAEARAEIRRCLLAARSVDSFSPDELWAERRKWFFKPARAYGGKAAYRGTSIARKAFSGLFGGGFIAQEFAPPRTIVLPGAQEGTLEEYKYDLRFFVYRGVVQLGLARLYQGQTTNAQTMGGGSACLRVSE